MEAPADLAELIDRIEEVTADAPRFGCHFKVQFEGLDEIDVFIKSWAFPAMKGSEAEEHIMGTAVPMKEVRQFGGNEGFPCLIKLKRGGKQIRALMKHFLSAKWIPKVTAEYIAPGETAAEGEVVDFYHCKISTDQTSFEDDANTENVAIEGTFKYNYYIAR